MVLLDLVSKGVKPLPRPDPLDQEINQGTSFQGSERGLAKEELPGMVEIKPLVPCHS